MFPCDGYFCDVIISFLINVFVRKYIITNTF